jgi:hypothetical protein
VGKRLVVQREDVEACAHIAMALMDDAAEPEQIRHDMADLFDELNELLLYQPHGADGQRSLRLVPMSFKLKRFHCDMVEELLLDLGEDVVADHPAQVLMARQAAELVDNDS